MMFPGQVRYLTPYEEAVGLLNEIIEKDGILVTLIGKIHLALPSDLELSLQPMIGQRIAILRTDLPSKQYLFRVLAKEPNLEKKEEP